MQLHWIDWLVIISYVAFAVCVGLRYAKKAGSSSEEYFLSGRSLPWWITGTSMVATTFAADTPLVVTGWVRDSGIWKNWLWWCYAIGGMMTVFLFARYWRRGNVMTTAELSELRYGGKSAGVLRGFLGFYHAGITNTIVLCWVILAAAKIVDVLFDVDKMTAIAAACGISLSYSLLAGFWGVVVTDLLQFAMAMTGGISLAWLSWRAVDGMAGLTERLTTEGIAVAADTFSLLPTAGVGGFMDLTFWTVPVATVAVYLGVAWWSSQSVDGGGVTVQRVSASKDERHGMLAVLWYSIAHYAMRPWIWVLVALASLAIFPVRTIDAPANGTVTEVSAEAISIQTDAGLRIMPLVAIDEMGAPLAKVKEGDAVRSGDVLARTDSELAYVAMMTRFLPVGLLGLVVASLLAAFMSTIDTHVNLASSYFVNDVYKRFLAPDADAKSQVLAARLSSVVIMILGGVMAFFATSISDLFTFFIAFLGGVGPVYLGRWLWWRVRASTEIVAMLTSSIVTITLTFGAFDWDLGPLSSGGALLDTGRLILVVSASIIASLLSMLLTRTPDPKELVSFYQKIRPVGAWGPVRELAGVSAPKGEGAAALTGILGGLALIYGAMFALGNYFLDHPGQAGISLAFAVCGGFAVRSALTRLEALRHQEKAQVPEYKA
jgi:SSS family solute:Na+ symporter